MIAGWSCCDRFRIEDEVEEAEVLGVEVDGKGSVRSSSSSSSDKKVGRISDAGSSESGIVPDKKNSDGGNDNLGFENEKR